MSDNEKWTSEVLGGEKFRHIPASAHVEFLRNFGGIFAEYAGIFISMNREKR